MCEMSLDGASADGGEGKRGRNEGDGQDGREVSALGWVCCGGG